MYKKHPIILLPTDEKASYPEIWLMHNKSQGLMHLKTATGLDGIGQHLYILSDDKPLKNDWILDIKNPKKPRQIKTEHFLEDLFETEKKIIATTNTSLNINKEYVKEFPESLHDMIFPQIHTSFIQHYIEQYNIGNVITEVEVEYFTDIPVISDKEYNMVESGELSYKNTNPYNIDILKLNTDNTINIKPLKNSWTREEQVDVIEKYLLLKEPDIYSKTSRTSIKEWIKNNL